MKTEKTFSIKKLKHSIPWLLYYSIASVNFFITFYYDSLTIIPFGIINNPCFLLLILFTYITYSIYIQSPPSILAHTRQIHASLIKKLIITVALSDALILGIIARVCTSKQYITTLLIVTIIIQIVIYSEYILKIIIPTLHRTPLDNYISIISHLDTTDMAEFGIFRFYFYFYLFVFAFIVLFIMLFYMCTLPMSNFGYSEFIFKSIFCYWTFYTFMYLLITLCVISFYLNINSGCSIWQSFRIISKIVTGNIGVCIYMAAIKMLCVLLAPLEIFCYIESARQWLEYAGNKYFGNIVFYKKVGIKSIIAITAVLEVEPHEASEFLKKIETTGNYPYINSFKSVDSGNTTKKTSLCLIITILIPLSLIILFGSLFTNEFRGYLKLVVSLVWASYATSHIGYIYTETMHYAAVLSNVQGNLYGMKWVDAHLNAL
ncbi:hypothetical protein NEMIN01_2336 [Nematocida minor]|uniref:uncharacterized protein n=1 Tax=Nematocida minor TaxID=1912983 RepID=UPI00221E654E|nr:uncharacterized protein NEMIN01_2336 [Nematocida minor]KAI5192989.1 hypothetical protein NEMIN01_2336 [Nematocida minor]